MLTNFDTNAIINDIIFQIKKGKVKFFMEVNADNIEKIFYPHCKQNTAWCESKGMTETESTKGTIEGLEEVNASLREITYYFIQLFYKTNKRYSCTQTKMGKLLSILAFRYAKRNKQKLFNEMIFRYPPCCGTLIKDLVFIPKDIYTRELGQVDFDDSQHIDDELIDNVEIPLEYRKTDNLSASLKSDIEYVFREFGAYPGDVLGTLLNPIVQKIIDNDSEPIVLSKLSGIERNDYGTDENIILEYIYSK